MLRSHTQLSRVSLANQPTNRNSTFAWRRKNETNKKYSFFPVCYTLLYTAALSAQLWLLLVIKEMLLWLRMGSDLSLHIFLLTHLLFFHFPMRRRKWSFCAALIQILRNSFSVINSPDANRYEVRKINHFFSLIKWIFVPSHKTQIKCGIRDAHLSYEICFAFEIDGGCTIHIFSVRQTNFDLRCAALIHFHSITLSLLKLCLYSRRWWRRRTRIMSNNK